MTTSHSQTCRHVLFLCIAAAFAAATGLHAQDATDAMNLDDLLGDLGARYPGSPANLALEERVAKRFAASGFEHGEIRFRAPTLEPGEATMTVGDAAFELDIMHPTVFRPGNFRSRTFDTSLVYLGEGDADALEALDGIDLTDTIGVLEFASDDVWMSLLRFGFRGFIFLGDGNYSRYQSLGKIADTETRCPRFFLAEEPAEQLRSLLRATAPPVRRAHVESKPTRWKNQILRNLWVLVPGSDPDLDEQVIAFNASIDANSLVPARATGAQNGANLHLLLRQLEHYRNNPPARTVLLAAVNAHTQGFLGDRMLAWYTTASSDALGTLRDIYAERARVQETLLSYYAKLQDLSSTEDLEAEQLLIEMRTLEDSSSGTPLTVKDPIVALIKRDVNVVKGELLRIRRDEDIPKAEKKVRRERMNNKLQNHVNVLTLFNRVGVQTVLSDLSAEELDLLKSYISTLVARYRTWSELNREDLARDVANEDVRKILPDRRVRIAIQLDLTWNTDQIGFSSVSEILNDQNWSASFGDNTVRIAKETLPENSPIEFLDTMTNFAGLGQKYYFPNPESAVDFYHASKVPAFAIKNAFDDGGRAFTPADTLDQMDTARIEQQQDALIHLFDALLGDSRITRSSQLPAPGGRRLWSKFIENYKFDELAASVKPELPVPNSVSIVYPGDTGDKAPPPITAKSVANRYIVLTDERATAAQYALPQRNGAKPTAFQFDEDFVHVLHTIDIGAAQERISSTLAPNTSTHTLALFRGREFPVVSRTDSSQLSFVPLKVDSYLPMTASQNSAPRKYGMTGISSKFSNAPPPAGDGPGAVFMRDDRAIKLVTENKRTAINASLDNPEGAGFSNPEDMDRDFFADVVRDMGYLNDFRLKKLQGVTNALVQQFRARAKEEQEAMQEARQQNRHLSYLKHQYAALGSRTKAYSQIAAITNDMLKAVVFYMALLLPFCFFLQKLLFKFSRIEAELIMFSVLFVLTFLVFRMIHPAFRVARAPEAIFIAFIMGVLGMFVLNILHSRFAGEMKLLFMTYSGVDTSEVGYSTVGQKAMLIGVNNMKRRRIRTTLTTTTIILVTFTMLAFSSISKKMSPTVISISDSTPYKGMFYQWPGNLRMDEDSLRVLRNLFHGKTEKIVVRRWMLPEEGSENRPGPPFTLSSEQGTHVQIQAVLGVPPDDDGFIAPMPILPGGRFFSSPSADEAVLPASAANALGLNTDDVGKTDIVFRGHRLRLVGLLDGDRLRMIKDLNDQPILPIKDIEQGGLQQQESAGKSTTIDPTAEKSGVFFVNPSALLVLPERTAKEFGAKPFSVSIQVPENTNLWDEIESMLTTTEAKFFISSNREFQVGPNPDNTTDAGVYYIGSGYKTSIGGLSRLIIPILIAGTIILNTMLGAVYERKQEIAVYNAIGLNPTHIGLFFLAEALVYSVIGAVGGYLIGQILTLTIDHFNLVPGLNLNFSSLSVVYVILFTIAIVLLSTLYPAVVATREAVPSGKRKWSLPDHEGGTMSIEFPFIYQPSKIVGLMGYLQEYFSRFGEASVGEMIVHLESVNHEQDDQDRDIYEVTYNIALAPYDLGVTQLARFRMAYDDHVNCYRLTMHVEQLSGQDAHWATTNKPFLEKLRQHLMHWRNLTPESRSLYQEHGNELFRDQ